LYYILRMGSVACETISVDNRVTLTAYVANELLRLGPHAHAVQLVQPDDWTKIIGCDKYWRLVYTASAFPQQQRAVAAWNTR
jgi:hypothetical protein